MTPHLQSTKQTVLPGGQQNPAVSYKNTVPKLMYCANIPKPLAKQAKTAHNESTIDNDR